MKFRSLRNRKRKTYIRLLKLIFPAVGATVLWKIFHQERHSRITVTEGLKNGEFFWQSFFSRLQKKDERTIFWEISFQDEFCGILAFSTIVLFKKKFLFLKFFAIEKRFQGKGIGGAVIKNIEKMAQKKGYYLIFLLSSPFKREIQKFYRKRNFHRIFWGVFWKKVKKTSSSKWRQIWEKFQMTLEYKKK